MIDYPKFIKMQKIFHGKFMIVSKVQLVAETQIVIADGNVVDVIITTKNKATEEQVFKDREPRKTKSVID
jgi:uncharacterized protein YueI